MILLLRYWRHLAGAVLLLAALTLAYSWAHSRGYRAAEAHYEPILAAIREEAVRAEERRKATEKAHAQAVERLSQEYLDRARNIENRAADTERRLASRLRDAARSCGVPEAARAATGADGAAPERAGDGSAGAVHRIAGGIAGVGEGCELDAHALRLWQEFYRTVRANTSQ